jgi:hypothetical protein
MDTSFRSKKWLESGLDRISEEKAISGHITYFYSDSLPIEQWIPLSILEFQNIITQLDSIGNPCRCGVIIPLVSKWKKMRLQPPATLKEINAQVNESDPPSLFLEIWEKKYYLPIQEYCFPVNSNLLLNPKIINQPIEKFYTYYRELRYNEDIVNNWEFIRRIYFEYFPNGNIGFR